MVFIDLLEKNSKKHLKKLTMEQALETLAEVPESEWSNWYYWQKGMAQWKPINTNDDLVEQITKSKLPPVPLTEVASEMVTELAPLDSKALDDDTLDTVATQIEGGDFDTAATETASTETAAATVYEDQQAEPTQATATEMATEVATEEEPVNEVVDINYNEDATVLTQESPDQPPPHQNLKERRRTKRFELNFRLMITNGHESFISYSNNISLGGIKLAHELPESFLGSECEIYVMNSDSKESVQLACRIVGTPTNKDSISFSGGSAEVVAKLNSWLLDKISNQNNQKAS